MPELPDRLRMYVTGPVTLTSPAASVFEVEFPSRQARRLFVYLVLKRLSGTSSEDLADAIWPGEPPDAWRAGLAAMVSKLRKLLRARFPGLADITMDFGAYRLRVPAASWVDVEAAAGALERAQAALRRDQPREAWGFANVAATIGARPFLAGEEGGWIDVQRTALRTTQLSSCECLAALHLLIGNPDESVKWAQRAIDVEPLRDSGHRSLMAALNQAGNPSEAVRAYHTYRRMLAEELGADPAPEVERLYLHILRADGNLADAV